MKFILFVPRVVIVLGCLVIVAVAYPTLGFLGRTLEPGE